ncbi:MAG TPA: SET domain-containing protein-lysine N-methyltransferase [Rhabdochlamydiaceae bacterium]|jgi:hypothetical protein
MKYLLDEKTYTLEELQEHLQFRYLPQIAFESVEQREDVYARGIDKQDNKDISVESLELGERFHSYIEKAYIPAVSVRWVNARVGYGLFAQEDVEAGAYVGEYTGIVRKNDRRYFEPLNNYCYEYPVADEIGRSFVVDATQGNLTRFINHSFEPNLKPLHVFYKGYYHLIFLATQPVAAGSQLFYNYGQSYWYLREKPETAHNMVEATAMLKFERVLQI